MVSFTSAEIDAWLAAFLWPFLRVAAVIGAAPLLRDAGVPARVKVGLAALVTLVIVPTLPAPAVTLAGPQAPLVAAQQVLIGIALAWSLRIVFAAVETAGELIGLQMGLSFGGFIDPQSGAQAPIVGGFLGLLATLVFLGMDGHLMMIAALAQSFAVVPIGAPTGPITDPARLAALGGAIFALGLKLAAAPAATLLLVNLSLGVLARSAPQLNVFAVGFPATLLVGFVALLAALRVFLPGIEAALENALATLGR